MFSEINSYTLNYGIIGFPVRHSFSPLIHNAGFRKKDINAVYTAFEVEPKNLKTAVEGIRALGIKGLSVTIPHKQNILPLLDEVSPIAQNIGSVNTVINDNGHLIGTNTDAYGLYRALSEVCDPNDLSVAILGSGGTARAATFALFHYTNPREVTLVARNPKTRNELATHIRNTLNIDKQRLTTEDISNWNNIKDKFNIIIQTTPLGMIPKSETSILSLQDMPEKKVVMDIVYQPHKTRFLSYALQKSNKVVYGIDMLLYQGIRQFELWTTQDAPIDIMREVLLKTISSI